MCHAGDPVPLPRTPTRYPLPRTPIPKQVCATLATSLLYLLSALVFGAVTAISNPTPNPNPNPKPYPWPGPLRELMTAPASPLADFYPTTFKQDLNGAHAAWKAVPLLPFIEQARDRVRARVRVRVPLLPFIEQARDRVRVRARVRVPLLPFIEQARDRVRARVRKPLLPFIEQDRLRRCLAINLILTLSLSLFLSLSLAKP